MIRSKSSIDPQNRTGLVFVLGVAIVGLSVGSLFLGYQTLGLTQLWQAVVAYDPGQASHVVIVDIRLPRVIGACIAGAALGTAGALMQTMTRNPLADPGILGVNAGAALGVVVSISILGVTDPAQFVWAALISCLAVSSLVFLVGGTQNADGARLLIAGAAIMAVCLAITRAVLLLSRQTLETYRFWVLGGLDGVTFDVLAALLPFLVAGAVLAWIASFWLNAMVLGTDVATGLGVRTGVIQGATALSVVLLCGATVSMTGPIAFIGLVSAHIARHYAHADAQRTVLLSALIGSGLLLFADLMGRLFFLGGNLQAGVMSALIGGPILITMIHRNGASRL